MSTTAGTASDIITTKPIKAFQDIDRSRFDDKNEERSVGDVNYGINEKLVRWISSEKNEPEWMLKKRLDGLKAFQELHMPNFGPSLKKLNLDEICYYRRADEEGNAKTWEDVPEDVKTTFEKLGIPEAERAVLAGVGAQYESENVYHKLKEEWTSKGVIFEDMDVAIQEHPELVKEYFMNKCVPIKDHKFAALHAAVWSGGTFLYIPKDVDVTAPLQAYFRMNASRGGQFEHTLIIIEEGAQAHYIEGCSAPQYGMSSLHAGCVEVFVKKGARFRYSSVENWSKNTYNLNTKRAIVEDDGIMEWVGGNLGSGVTMLYPCTILKGDRSRADHLSVAFAGDGQFQDTGAKVIHVGKETKSNVLSKGLSKDGGTSNYRGLLRILPNASGSQASVNCDNLILDRSSISCADPVMEIHEDSAEVSHEAKVGSIGEEELFYTMSRGLSEEEAIAMIVQGFIEPIVKELPLEYAVELNRLIELEMEGA
ncbi:MAG: Fe-S cluster assembly protein SufB [Candidatus Gracilibacteria bacterium]|nr:Fe-S cluster assembly protein SufB [Candidatus Gracilibacteria bacterium]